MKGVVSWVVSGDEEDVLVFLILYGYLPGILDADGLRSREGRIEDVCRVPSSEKVVLHLYAVIDEVRVSGADPAHT